MTTGTYTIHFTNQSANFWNVCIFQKEEGWESIAWITKKVYTGTSVEFTWVVEYCFTWLETGNINQGISYTARQVVPIMQGYENTATLDFNNGFFFTDISQNTGSENSLCINQSNNIPVNCALIGIGMAGSPIVTLPAQPNVGIVFTPKEQPIYWITFGDYISGQPIDMNQMTAPYLELKFPPNVNSLYVSIDQGNEWHVSQYPA